MAATANSVELKKGWLKKANRSGGIFKSWKQRFVVLDNGKLYYYEKESKSYPFGETLKGQYNLRAIQFGDTRYDYTKAFWIHLVGLTEGDLILDGVNLRNTAEWKVAIRRHINFATTGNPDVDAYPNFPEMAPVLGNPNRGGAPVAEDFVLTVMHGWLKKANRSGAFLFRSWTSRYIVLDQGKLYYYEKNLNRYPFGESLKGEYSLQGVKFGETQYDAYKANWIQLVGLSQGDLILCAENAKMTAMWMRALRRHVDAANNPEKYSSAAGSVSNGNPNISSVAGGKDKSGLPSFLTEDVTSSSANNNSQAAAKTAAIAASLNPGGPGSAGISAVAPPPSSAPPNPRQSPSLSDPASDSSSSAGDAGNAGAAMGGFRLPMPGMPGIGGPPTRAAPTPGMPGASGPPSGPPPMPGAPRGPPRGPPPSPGMPAAPGIVAPPNGPPRGPPPAPVPVFVNPPTSISPNSSITPILEGDDDDDDGEDEENHLLALEEEAAREREIEGEVEKEVGADADDEEELFPSKSKTSPRAKSVRIGGDWTQPSGNDEEEEEDIRDSFI